MNKLEVINNAMLKAGLPLAADLADCDYNALHVYDIALTEALQAHNWNFARRYATLEEVENPNTFGKKYAYRLPEDFVSKVDARPTGDTRSPAADCEPLGNLLLCNIRPCNLRYTARITDPNLWPANFAEAVSALIASKIAALSAEKMSLRSQLMTEYNLQLNMARATDAREAPGRMPQGSGFLSARQEAGGNQ